MKKTNKLSFLHEATPVIAGGVNANSMITPYNATIAMIASLVLGSVKMLSELKEEITMFEKVYTETREEILNFLKSIDADVDYLLEHFVQLLEPLDDEYHQAMTNLCGVRNMIFGATIISWAGVVPFLLLPYIISEKNITITLIIIWAVFVALGITTIIFAINYKSHEHKFKRIAGELKRHVRLNKNGKNH